MFASPDQIAEVAHNLHTSMLLLANSAGFTALQNSCRFSQANWKIPLENGSLYVQLLGDGITERPNFGQSPLVWADLSLEVNDERKSDYFFGSWFEGEQAVIDSRIGNITGSQRNVYDLLQYAGVKTIREMAQMIIQNAIDSTEHEYSKFVRIGGLEAEDNGLSVAVERHEVLRMSNRITEIEVEVVGNELDPIAFRASMIELPGNNLQLLVSRYAVARIGAKIESEVPARKCKVNELTVTLDQIDAVKRQGHLALENAAIQISRTM